MVGLVGWLLACLGGGWQACRQVGRERDRQTMRHEDMGAERDRETERETEKARERERENDRDRNNGS